MAKATHVVHEPRSRVRGKKGDIIKLYTDCPDGERVICLDEMGPTAAKVYPARQWSEEAHRPHFPVNYERRGYCWIFGALEPKTGRVAIESYPGRTTAALLEFLDKLEVEFPDGKIHVTLDNLSVQKSIHVLLWLWGHPRFILHFQPTYAAWLNLIEGFWKILHQRALDGSNYSHVPTMVTALKDTVRDWNENPTPFRWGYRKAKRAASASRTETNKAA